MAAELDRMIGGSKIASGTAILTALEREPCTLFATDEIGFVMQAVANRQRASKHEAESREERRRIRAAAANNERERRKLLRAERRDFVAGAAVTIKGMDALAGLTGVVESSDGTSAVVSFGGGLTMKVEAWQLVEDTVHAARSVLAAE